MTIKSLLDEGARYFKRRDEHEWLTADDFGRIITLKSGRVVTFTVEDLTATDWEAKGIEFGFDDESMPLATSWGLPF